MVPSDSTRSTALPPGRDGGTSPMQGEPSAPAITRFGAGFFLFVRGIDNHIHYKSLGSNRESWGVWQRIPDGLTPSAPAVASGLLLVRGTDDRLYHNSFDGSAGWTGWERLPGGLTRDAPALAHAPGYF